MPPKARKIRAYIVKTPTIFLTWQTEVLRGDNPAFLTITFATGYATTVKIFVESYQFCAQLPWIVAESLSLELLQWVKFDRTSEYVEIVIWDISFAQPMNKGAGKEGSVKKINSSPCSTCSTRNGNDCIEHNFEWNMEVTWVHSRMGTDVAWDSPKVPLILRQYEIFHWVELCFTLQLSFLFTFDSGNWLSDVWRWTKVWKENRNWNWLIRN